MQLMSLFVNQCLDFDSLKNKLQPLRDFVPQAFYCGSGLHPRPLPPPHPPPHILSMPLGWIENDFVKGKIGRRLILYLRSHKTEILAGVSEVHRACYLRRPSLPGGCCICLEQFAGDSTFVAVTASFPAEDWRLNFLPGLTAVLPPWTSHCTDYYVTLHYCYVSLQS